MPGNLNIYISMSLPDINQTTTSKKEILISEKKMVSKQRPMDTLLQEYSKRL
jgi:hypothetical protein